jgi:hypothetical protein
MENYGILWDLWKYLGVLLKIMLNK